MQITISQKAQNYLFFCPKKQFNSIYIDITQTNATNAHIRVATIKYRCKINNLSDSLITNISLFGDNAVINIGNPLMNTCSN